MKCTIAKTAGFCGGVNRAFMMVKDNFEKKDKGRVLILGSLVHNENVMAIVRKMGITEVNSLEEVQEGDTVIITAHGVSEQVYEEIKRRGADIFDSTCPKVKMVQDHAKEHSIEGYTIVIFGDREHKEIKGINGWCNNKAIIVGNIEEVEELAESFRKKEISEGPVLLIAQTTQNIEKFAMVKEMLSEAVESVGYNFKSIDTICRATSIRQEEARRIAKEQEAVIVIGGKDSANTKQLWKIAKSENPRTIWVEDEKGLERDENKRMLIGVDNVGIISGASTAVYDIERVKIAIDCDE